MTVAVAVVVPAQLPPPAAAATPAELWQAQQTTNLTHTGNVYTNHQYGFTVAILGGATGWASTPPLPNHGVRIILGWRRTIEVSASYDAPEYGSTKALLNSMLADEKSATIVRTTIRLAGLPAEQAAVAHGDERETLIAQRLGTDDTAINCTLSLATDAGDQAADGSKFAQVLATFRHLNTAT